ncbi:hypothetical protein Vafri_20779 [Volvox africanus]|uniref:Uncharacterized protein n=1 Tax=Volvox africanus TaxID=51714 RepID=A0A8J4BUB9_9CHLO|nr:hypothetical protein Vafri_20779 [Volvox africanus]
MNRAATVRFADGAARLCPGGTGGGDNSSTGFAFRPSLLGSATGTVGLRECVLCTSAEVSGTVTRYNSDWCQSATGPPRGFQASAAGAGAAVTVAVSVVRAGLRGSDPRVVQTVAPEMRV